MARLKLAHSQPADAVVSDAGSYSRLRDTCYCGPGRVPTHAYACLACLATDRAARERDERMAYERRRKKAGR